MKLKCLLVCKSITYAQKINNILTKKGYFCILTKTPSDIKLKSCSYSVTIYQKDMEKVLKLLNDFKIGGVTIYTFDGRFYIYEGAI